MVFFISIYVICAMPLSSLHGQMDPASDQSPPVLKSHSIWLSLNLKVERDIVYSRHHIRRSDINMSYGVCVIRVIYMNIRYCIFWKINVIFFSPPFSAKCVKFLPVDNQERAPLISFRYNPCTIHTGMGFHT